MVGGRGSERPPCAGQRLRLGRRRASPLPPPLRSATVERRRRGTHPPLPPPSPSTPVASFTTIDDGRCSALRCRCHQEATVVTEPESMKVVAAARRGEPSVARLICRRTRQQHGRWPPLPPSPAPPPSSSLPRRPWRAAVRLTVAYARFRQKKIGALPPLSLPSLHKSLSQGQRGNLCTAKATVGGGWTYGGGGGWLSGGSGGEGEGQTREMRCCCDVVYFSFHCMCCCNHAGNGAGEMGCCQRQLQDFVIGMDQRGT